MNCENHNLLYYNNVKYMKPFPNSFFSSQIVKTCLNVSFSFWRWSTLLDIPIFWLLKCLKWRVLIGVSFYEKCHLRKKVWIFLIILCGKMVLQSLALKAYLFNSSDIHNQVDSVTWFLDVSIQFKGCALYQTGYWIIYLTNTTGG